MMFWANMIVCGVGWGMIGGVLDYLWHKTLFESLRRKYPLSNNPFKYPRPLLVIGVLMGPLTIITTTVVSPHAD